MLNAVNSLRTAAANVLFLWGTRLAVCLVSRYVYATVSSQCIENRHFYLKRSFNVNFRLLCRKKLASKGWVLKVSHFQMNNITIIYIIVVIVVMSEDGRSEQADNGSSQNQTEGPILRGLLRRANKEVLPLWESLKEKKKCSKGKSQRLGQSCSCRFEEAIVKSIKLTSRIQGTASYYSEITSKELESLTQHMPNLSDIDARIDARIENVLHRTERGNFSD